MCSQWNADGVVEGLLNRSVRMNHYNKRAVPVPGLGVKNARKAGHNIVSRSKANS